MNLKNLQNKMTKEEIQDAIHSKAFAQISFIELQLNSLKKELPSGAYTQEMIDNQIRFHTKELKVWNTIMDQND